MNVLGLIPARSGSKGIERKNLALLDGKPLIAYTIAAAKGSEDLGTIVLSTDDEEIASVGRSLGIDVPFMRPKELAADSTPMVDVILHVLGELVKRGEKPDAVVLLQPTSPLRTSAHIDQAIDLLIASGADTVVSVALVPHQFVPTSLMELQGEQLQPLAANPVLARQEKPMLYARNGPAILAVRTEFLLREEQFYSGNTRPFVMDSESSIDIDGPEDLAYAEFLLKKRG